MTSNSSKQPARKTSSLSERPNHVAQYKYGVTLSRHIFLPEQSWFETNWFVWAWLKGQWYTMMYPHSAVTIYTRKRLKP